jgi:transposase
MISTRVKSLKDNKMRRITQNRRTYIIKFDLSHLSKAKLHYLNMLFVEAKWLYNYILSTGDIFAYDAKSNIVITLDKDGNKIERKLEFLSASMKQTVNERMIWSIRSLSSNKKNGNHIGKLKYKSEINSINLRQFNHTYKFKNCNRYVKLEKCKYRFKVLGFRQIPENAEFANALLIKRNGNFYLKVVCYLPKAEKKVMNKSIGLDFGIKNSITDSDGNKHNFQFSETKQLKKASKRVNRSVKGSKNRSKRKLILRKQYEKLTNMKVDIGNKFVNKLIKENDCICIQDESIHEWHSSKNVGFGRKVQCGIMGGIIASLKTKPVTLIVPKYFKSTQICNNCGSLNFMSLSDRIYLCKDCGYFEDRDVNSANNILDEGLKQIGMVHINSMSVDEMLNTQENLNILEQSNSKKQKASIEEVAHGCIVERIVIAV